MYSVQHGQAAPLRIAVKWLSVENRNPRRVRLHLTRVYAIFCPPQVVMHLRSCRCDARTPQRLSFTPLFYRAMPTKSMMTLRFRRYHVLQDARHRLRAAANWAVARAVPVLRLGVALTPSVPCADYAARQTGAAPVEQ